MSKLTWKTVPFLRRNLGIVFQDFQLLTDRNVYENLEFVLKATGWTDASKIKTKIHSVLEKVGLKDHENKMTLDYDKKDKWGLPLLDFDVDGYGFNESLSNREKNKWVFTRKSE